MRPDQDRAHVMAASVRGLSDLIARRRARLGPGPGRHGLDVCGRPRCVLPPRSIGHVEAGLRTGNRDASVPGRGLSVPYSATGRPSLCADRASPRQPHPGRHRRRSDRPYRQHRCRRIAAHARGRTAAVAEASPCRTSATFSSPRIAGKATGPRWGASVTRCPTARGPPRSCGVGADASQP